MAMGQLTGPCRTFLSIVVLLAVLPHLAGGSLSVPAKLPFIVEEVQPVASWVPDHLTAPVSLASPAWVGPLMPAPVLKPEHPHTCQCQAPPVPQTPTPGFSGFPRDYQRLPAETAEPLGHSLTDVLPGTILVVLLCFLTGAAFQGSPSWSRTKRSHPGNWRPQLWRLAREWLGSTRANKFSTEELEQLDSRETLKPPSPAKKVLRQRPLRKAPPTRPVAARQGAGQEAKPKKGVPDLPEATFWDSENMTPNLEDDCAKCNDSIANGASSTSAESPEWSDRSVSIDVSATPSDEDSDFLGEVLRTGQWASSRPEEVQEEVSKLNDPEEQDASNDASISRADLCDKEEVKSEPPAAERQCKAVTEEVGLSRTLDTAAADVELPLVPPPETSIAVLTPPPTGPPPPPPAPAAVPKFESAASSTSVVAPISPRLPPSEPPPRPPQDKSSCTTKTPAAKESSKPKKMAKSVGRLPPPPPVPKEVTQVEKEMGVGLSDITGAPGVTTRAPLSPAFAVPPPPGLEMPDEFVTPWGLLALAQLSPGLSSFTMLHTGSTEEAQLRPLDMEMDNEIQQLLTSTSSMHL